MFDMKKLTLEEMKKIVAGIDPAAVNPFFLDPDDDNGGLGGGPPGTLGGG